MVCGCSSGRAVEQTRRVIASSYVGETPSASGLMTMHVDTPRDI